MGFSLAQLQEDVPGSGVDHPPEVGVLSCCKNLHRNSLRLIQLRPTLKFLPESRSRGR